MPAAQWRTNLVLLLTMCTIKMPAAQWRTNLVLQLQQRGVGFVDGEGARDLGCALHLGHHDHVLATRLGPVGQALEMEQNQHDDS